jgi:hypothetical protein
MLIASGAAAVPSTTVVASLGSAVRPSDAGGAADALGLAAAVVDAGGAGGSAEHAESNARARRAARGPRRRGIAHNLAPDGGAGGFPASRMAPVT